MALNQTPRPTAWGSIHVFIGDTGENDAMASEFYDLGSVKDDTFTIETEAGEEYELKDINGKLLDSLKQEPTLNLNFSLIKISEETMGKFWKVSEEGSGDSRKVKVTSMIQNKLLSVKFANVNAIGSETFEAPKCRVSLEPKYEKDKGFSGDCVAKILWPTRTGDGVENELFQFGVVAEQ